MRDIFKTLLHRNEFTNETSTFIKYFQYTIIVRSYVQMLFNFYHTFYKITGIKLSVSSDSKINK